MNSLFDSKTRRIAMTALLIASFLEICGCNPTRTCDQLRLTRLSAIPLPALLQQCAACLTSQEMATLRQAADGSIERGITAVVTTNLTLGEALFQLRGPSFDADSDSSTQSMQQEDEHGTHSAAMDDLLASQSGGPIAWPISKSVLLLYDRLPTAGLGAHRIGTGIVLTVADHRRRTTARFLVTARHVVDPEWASCGEKNPSSIVVRFNRLLGGVGYETLALEDHGGSSIITPSDDVTDLALIPLPRATASRIERYELDETAFDSLPTAFELSSFHPAQRVVTVGISAPRMYGLTDVPIPDSGVLTEASSRGPVKVRCSPESRAVPIQLWMINTSISEHVSGAPVYAELVHGRNGEIQPMLVGFQSAVWTGRGIAGMTPVTALTELVQSTLNRDEMAMNLRGGTPH